MTCKEISSPALWDQLAKIGEGIDFIHKSLNMQHLDLKPSNILIFETHNSGGTQHEICVDATSESSSPSLPRPLSESLGSNNSSTEGFVIFKIGDLGQSNLGAYDNHEKSTGSGPPIVLGLPNWGPPEWKVLSSTGNQEAFEQYDYWSFGAILLEAAVFDTWVETTIKSDGVKEFRKRRQEQGSRGPNSLTFYTNYMEKWALKTVVAQKLRALKEFNYGPTHDSDGHKAPPVAFYSDLSKHIEQLLSIEPEKRKPGPLLRSIIKSHPLRPITPREPGHSLPSPGVEPIYDPPEAEPRHTYIFLDPQNGNYYL
ncbi:hypothetical protein ABW20_dc0110631 [Dactylellina cionopaga]|nr:hypothetical protein ABW20_dc0110631 [Dactylellina cionopaga]